MKGIGAYAYLGWEEKHDVPLPRLKYKRWSFSSAIIIMRGHKIPVTMIMLIDISCLLIYLDVCVGKSRNSRGPWYARKSRTPSGESIKLGTNFMEIGLLVGPSGYS